MRHYKHSSNPCLQGSFILKRIDEHNVLQALFW